MPPAAVLGLARPWLPEASGEWAGAWKTLAVSLSASPSQLISGTREDLLGACCVVDTDVPRGERRGDSLWCCQKAGEVRLALGLLWLSPISAGTAYESRQPCPQMPRNVLSPSGTMSSEALR